MSVALVAVARVARPSRRVTCVRVPQPPRPSSPTAQLADLEWPIPPFPFDDPALWQPTEVMRALVVAPGDEAELTAEAEADTQPTLAPEADTQPTLAPERDSIPAGELEPEAAPEPTAAPELDAEPAPAAAPDPAPAAAPAPATDPADAWGWTEPWAFEIPDPATIGRRARATTRDGSQRPARRRRPRGARTQPHRPQRRLRHPMIPLAVIVIAAAVSVWATLPHSPTASASPTVSTHAANTAAMSYSPRPSAFALRTIPANYLHYYWHAASVYGLDWTKLAAVGQIESDQGRSATPGVAQGTNPSGAAGPAQFLGTTWARYGVDVDGSGTMNPYDPADAITAMAAYLKASGAPENWPAALYTYNHSTAYVDAVLTLSRRFLGA